MEKEKQLTAVEFLEDKLMNHPYGGVYFPHNTKELFKQAKAMEREQIIEAYNDGNYAYGMGISEAEQYYNETFKS